MSLVPLGVPPTSNGQGPVPAHLLTRQPCDRVPLPPSEQREGRVLRLLAEEDTALTVREIAGELGLALASVKDTLASLGDLIVRRPVPAGKTRERSGRFQYSLAGLAIEGDDEDLTQDDLGEEAA